MTASYHSGQYMKQVLDKFYSMCYTRNCWEVWADLIAAMACAIANSSDINSERYSVRENEYMKYIKRLGGIEIPSEIFALITMALDENPEQDFLGTLFMELGLGNHWKGQFFTPYNVCKAMAEINMSDLNQKIQEKGWVSINDCACGAGATLIAAANCFKNNGINYQNHALFIAQDIDRIAGMMCYIQLSLLGSAGYVAIADSLTNPVEGNALLPMEKSGQEFWYTPMYFSDVWHFRRLFSLADGILK